MERGKNQESKASIPLNQTHPRQAAELKQAYKEILIQYKAQFSKKRDGENSLRSSVEICDPKHITPQKIRPENMTIEQLLRKHMESDSINDLDEKTTKHETAFQTNFDNSFIEPFENELSLHHTITKESLSVGRVSVNQNMLNTSKDQNKLPFGVDPYNRQSPENFKIKTRHVMPITNINDSKKISEARNDLRKHHFFHQEYEPRVDEKYKKPVNNKIYTFNSKEPDFKFIPEKEPSLNHYLLSQANYANLHRSPLADDKTASTKRNLMGRTRNQSAKRSPKYTQKKKSPEMTIKINYAAGKVEMVPKTAKVKEEANKTSIINIHQAEQQPGLAEQKELSRELDEHTYRPIPLEKLKRIFETAEKGLSRYMHPTQKKQHFFTVKELERFIELGHSSSDFHNLMEEHKKVQIEVRPDSGTNKNSSIGTSPSQDQIKSMLSPEAYEKLKRFTERRGSIELIDYPPKVGPPISPFPGVSSHGTPTPNEKETEIELKIIQKLATRKLKEELPEHLHEALDNQQQISPPQFIRRASVTFQDQPLDLKAIMQMHFKKLLEQSVKQQEQGQRSLYPGSEPPSPRRRVSLFQKKVPEKTHINETERQKKMKAEFHRIRKRLSDMLGYNKRARRGGILNTTTPQKSQGQLSPFPQQPPLQQQLSPTNYSLPQFLSSSKNIQSELNNQEKAKMWIIHILVRQLYIQAFNYII